MKDWRVHTITLPYCFIIINYCCPKSLQKSIKLRLKNYKPISFSFVSAHKMGTKNSLAHFIETIDLWGFRDKSMCEFNCCS